MGRAPGGDELLGFIQVPRGGAPRDHVMPPGLTPTVFMMVNPMKPASAEQRHQGVACVTARDFRWERGDIKSISLLGNVLARQISADHGALETIMSVSYTHLRAHETVLDLVCRLLLEKKKKNIYSINLCRQSPIQHNTITLKLHNHVTIAQ